MISYMSCNQVQKTFRDTDQWCSSGITPLSSLLRTICKHQLPKPNDGEFYSTYNTDSESEILMYWALEILDTSPRTALTNRKGKRQESHIETGDKHISGDSKGTLRAHTKEWLNKGTNIGAKEQCCRWRAQPAWDEYQVHLQILWRQDQKQMQLDNSRQCTQWVVQELNKQVTREPT